MRILITGGPKTGKSTLAREIAPDSVHLCTDRLHEGGDLPTLSAPSRDALWSAESAFIAEEWLTQPGPWVIEGIAVPRALRKWHQRHPGEPPPCDLLLYLPRPHTPLSEDQRRLGKSVETVLNELRPWLGKRIRRL